MSVVPGDAHLSSRTFLNGLQKTGIQRIHLLVAHIRRCLPHAAQVVNDLAVSFFISNHCSFINCSNCFICDSATYYVKERAKPHCTRKCQILFLILYKYLFRLFFYHSFLFKVIARVFGFRIYRFFCGIDIIPNLFTCFCFNDDFFCEIN